MQSISLREKARLERKSWNPESAESKFVWHFSIPNFDDGGARAEEVKTIKSGKTLITKPCVLISKLNPSTPRVWLIEHLKPGVNVCSTEFLVVAPIDSRDLRYLYFVLKSPSAVSRLAAVASGSSTSHQRVRPSEVEALELVWLESSSRRQWVADCLWEIEEKIRANSHTSQTLKDLAAAIFKSWFIDFDPVKAKMLGEAPVGMDSETAALFSTSMQEAPEGLIPVDWEWGSVGGIADVVDCLHSKKPALIDEGKPFLQLNTIADDGILRYELSAGVSDEDYSKWTSRIEVSSGDCVVTNVGRVGAVSQIPPDFKAAIGRNMTAVRPRDKGEMSSFLFTALTSDYMRREIVANTDSGTILDALNVKNIPLLKIPMPPKALIRKFEEIAGPMIRLRHKLHSENVTLSSTRDALLPRLISGELEIPFEMLAEL